MLRYAFWKRARRNEQTLRASLPFVVLGPQKETKEMRELTRISFKERRFENEYAEFDP